MAHRLIIRDSTIIRALCQSRPFGRRCGGACAARECPFVTVKVSLTTKTLRLGTSSMFIHVPDSLSFCVSFIVLSFTNTWALTNDNSTISVLRNLRRFTSPLSISFKSSRQSLSQYSNLRLPPGDLRSKISIIHDIYVKPHHFHPMRAQLKFPTRNTQPTK